MREYLDSLEGLSRQQLVLMLARQRLQIAQGAALVGMACRFPGRLDSPERYWEALRRGRIIPDERRAVPADSTGRPRWDVRAADLAPLAPLLASGSYVDDIDLFEPERFGISDEEAAHMDPQQRLLLTCAAEALEDAGPIDRGQARVGVFTGVSAVEWHFARLRNRLGVHDLSAFMGTGGTLSATSARIAHGLRLNGPVMTIDTACSSALTAVHLALAALRRDECDLALVGACHLLLAPFTTAIFEKTGMLSPSGRTRPFDGAADGYVRGEGCGVLVLKRQRDVSPDKPPAYAMIRGSGVYQHGDRPAMAAASAVGQRRVMEQVLRDADVDPHQVQFIEMQANGVRVAGAIEVETVADVYGRAAGDAPPLYVGSAKANLGYLETASGMAGLMKAALALHHRVIPPQAALADLDPMVPWERLALRVPRKEVPWPDVPRPMAAVNAFGFTGTNAHVLMEGVAAAVPRPARAGGPGAGRHFWPHADLWS